MKMKKKKKKKLLRWMIGAALSMPGVSVVIALAVPFVVVIALFVGQSAGNAATIGGPGDIKDGAIPAYLVPLYNEAAHGPNGCSAVTPVLLAAQGKAESGFDPHAESHDKFGNVLARGIAQFIDPTWAAHGIDGDGDGVKDVYNPADAIPAQAAYDCSLAADVKGIPGDAETLMLAAYNAGPYAVIQYGGVPPFSETHAYIDNIQKFEKELAAPVGDLGGGGVGPLPSGVVGRMVVIALAHKGDPYVWAAAGPNSFDCSGLVQFALKEAGGPTLPHNAAMQYHALPHVSRAEVRPGDLVFFNPGEFQAGEPGHVGIMIDNGMTMVDAPHTGAVVRTEAIDGFGTLVGFARIGS